MDYDREQQHQANPAHHCPNDRPGNYPALQFKFAIVSDLHIALPHTIWDHPSRFHLVEVSIPVFEAILEHLQEIEIDFLLLPGDLTQHGERENHQWLIKRLARLPFPVYVIPGNHDIPHAHPPDYCIAPAEFPRLYEKFGYSNPKQPYYSQVIIPGVRLIGLNSNEFDDEDNQLGRLDMEQFAWLSAELERKDAEVTLVMIHHNVIEHLPGQSNSALGRRYILENASPLVSLLSHAGVQLVFTGHFHIQDIAQQRGVYDITTGSLVSYPHPYRILQFHQSPTGERWLHIESPRITTIEHWPNLHHQSREWMGDRSHPFIMRLLTHAPLHLPHAVAEALVPDLRYFWANIADGDSQFAFPQFPEPVRQYFESYSAVAPGQTQPWGDNQTTLRLA